MKTMIVALAAVAGLALQLPSAAKAGDCCACCGCQCPCEMTCHLVKYMKKVTVNCYGCKCNDFCIPGPSCPGCKHCEGCCDCGCEPKCGCDSECNQKPDCHLNWRDWCPTCACPHTAKQLVKYEVTKEIPAYKWVTEPLCCGCAEKAKADDKNVPAPAPPAPQKSADVPPSPSLSFAMPKR
jgi:hypothetical protein